MLHDFLFQITGKRSFKETLPTDIQNQNLKNFIKSLLETVLKNRFLKKKDFINIAGLPASGKSFWAKKFLEKNPEYIYISFDFIMEKFPEYQKEYKLDPKLAFERWELPAKYLGYYLLFKAIYLGYPILFEHSNANIEHIELYTSIRSFYYDLSIFFIDADPSLVLPRLCKRVRFFPESRIKERWISINQINPFLEKIAQHFYKIEPWKD